MLVACFGLLYSEIVAHQSLHVARVVSPALGGIRVATGVSWGTQIVTELIGGQQGIGQVFPMAMPMQALDLVIAGVLWITILAATTDMLFVWPARIVTAGCPLKSTDRLSAEEREPKH